MRDKTVKQIKTNQLKSWPFGKRNKIGVFLAIVAKEKKRHK